MKPFQTIDRVRHRMAEAMIAQSGMRHPGLAAHLREVLTRDDPTSEPGTLLRKPTIEGAFPYEPGSETLGELDDALLHPRLVAALDDANGSEDLRFPRDRHPYLHQMKAWRALSPTEDPHSVVVTSGTGSGKTECFLVPMLDDIVRRVETGQGGNGIEAIMLYPLNALIASQRERLNAWTAPLNGDARFCLYNGLLPEKLPRAEQREKLRREPQCVPDRQTLRASPPSILVTNLTMLEYMLVRAEDAPILQKSQGKLRWIVLDEAHTLVGAAAAEVSLLLRRVMLAFGVEPEQVRFVATSATIGDGDETKEKLRRFLADVGGISVDQVSVISGERILPTRPEGKAARPDADEIVSLSHTDLYARLGAQDDVWSLVKELKAGTVPPARIDEVAKTYGCDLEGFATALSRAKSTDDETLAPLRVHAMQRATPGLWSCLNPGCKGAPADWNFGRILHERAEHCSCGTAVAEICTCNDCGAVTLHVTERGGQLVPPMRQAMADEFALDFLRDTDDGEEDDGEGVKESEALLIEELCLATVGESGLRTTFLKPGTAEVLDVDTDDAITLDVLGDGKGPCPLCAARRGEGDKLFPFRFGAPFAIMNATPILIEGMPGADDKHETPTRTPAKPSGGRQLIAFTDSRQGTARTAAKLQSESERNFTRSMLYQIVQMSLSTDGPDDAEVLGQIAKLEAAQEASGSDLSSLIAEQKAKLKPAASVPWIDARDDLAARAEVRDWMQTVWADRDAVFSEGEPGIELANMLLYRELARRPRTANSVETMGLVRLTAPSLDRQKAPAAFAERGSSDAEWRTFLSFLLTYQLRANGVVAIPGKLRNWATKGAYIKRLLKPSMEKVGDGYYWPTARPHGARAARMLELALGLDAADALDRAILSDLLADARNAIFSVMTLDTDGTAQLDFTKLHLAPLTDAFLCPVTNRIVDLAPFGLSPYAAKAEDKVQPITLPRLALKADMQGRRDWLETDECIADLRGRGLWTALNDRIALFADYSRSAEHSAQLSRARLEGYENAFKDRQINVLSCSTTMEMGVDIGSVSGVMMTNVPPSIANYRQRIGRAGRRGQPLSLGFTIAKDRPLDREAFRNVDAYLRRETAAPRVALASAPLVQRHVNAYLLGRFIRESAGDGLRMTVGVFFGLPPGPDDPRPLKAERVVTHFLDWLNEQSLDPATTPNIARIIRGSVLEGRPRLIEASAERIGGVAKAIGDEWQAAIGERKGAEPPAISAIDNRIKRLTGEFLLGALCDRAFLPGHGFPTGVVSFEGTEPPKSGQGSAPGDDNRLRRGEAPSRPLDVALREYAPGAEIVVDGQVYRSGGVTLNWKRPSSDEGVNEVQDLGWAATCGSCGEGWTGRGSYPATCDACGSTELLSRNTLRPAGFRRDKGERTHAEVDTMRYVSLDPPRASAGDARWESLPGGLAFRHRSCSEGKVFHCNRGPNRLGYGLCLQCGRTEPMKQGEETCSALAGHNKLSHASPCEGNDRPFAVRHGVDLAHEIQTDVFELQPGALPDVSAANAIAIALRESLAARLGVEAGDIGFAVRESRNAMGARTRTLALFDRSAGGAGYAIRAAEDLRPLLREARAHLDCRNPRCENACSSCVLTGDAPTGADELDRIAGAAFMDDHLSLPPDLADEDAFVEGAALSDRPLHAIDAQLKHRAQATVHLFVADMDTAGLEDWIATPFIKRWNGYGHIIRIVFADGASRGWNDAERLAVRDYLNRTGASACEGLTKTYDNGAVCLAHITETAKSWATRDADALRAEIWGAATTPVACGPEPATIEATAIPDAALTPNPGAQKIVLSSAFNKDIDAFGPLMADRLRKAFTAAGHPEDARWSAATYSDRYLRSPLVIRLLHDTLAALLENGATVTVTTCAPDSTYGTPRQPFHDLPDGGSQTRFAEAYAQIVGLDLTIQTKRREMLAHARTLTLTASDGGRAEINFEWGFGWLDWKAGRRSFAWKSDAEAFARMMADLDGRLAARPSYAFALPPGI